MFTLTFSQVATKVPEGSSFLAIAIVIVALCAIWSLMALGRALTTMLEMLRVAATTLGTTLLIAFIPFVFLALLILIAR